MSVLKHDSLGVVSIIVQMHLYCTRAAWNKLVPFITSIEAMTVCSLGYKQLQYNLL